jgi:hypothetical protein
MSKFKNADLKPGRDNVNPLLSVAFDSYEVYLINILYLSGPNFSLSQHKL